MQKNVGRATLEEIIYVLERLISLWGLMNERGRILFGFMVRYVSDVRGVDAREVVYKIMERGGERVEREIRSFWDDIREEALREGLQQGLRQGLQQGLEQGLRQGLILEAQEMVLEALEERFGKVEKELSERIKKIEDRDFLRHLFKLSLRVSSLEEILRALEEIKRYD